MTTPTQKKATAAHRRRNRAKGLVRVEIQVPRADAVLLRNLAERLRAGILQNAFEIDYPPIQFLIQVCPGSARCRNP